ncbi:CYTH and CHAD domain-containing protein [Streptomyces sp.]|uniref:CYTH and CHAD domain-containing protein n=1 Tax=Streptomyces sp. TaxID=1931 RepID=UPI002F42BAE5
MTTVRTEEEAKFEGPGTFDLDGLRRLPDVARVREEKPEELDAVYYDTADLRLLAHAITLRRRSGGHDEGWHAKLPAEGGARREIHAPLRAGRPGKVPGELDRRVRAYTRGEDLIPVAHLRTHRRRHLLLDRQGRCLAEVAQDRVAAQILGTERLHPGDGRSTSARTDKAKDQGKGSGTGGSAGTSTQLTHWSEIEIEKDEGGAKLMRAAADWLVDHGWRPSPSAHKLDHALAPTLPPDFGTAGTPEQDRRPRPGSAGDAVMTRLGEQLGILLATDAAVRADEPDAVHLMRTTSRRLRSLLRSHRRVLDRERTEPVADELRWLTGVLGDSRDHEVLAQRLQQQARELRDPADTPLARRIGAEEQAQHDQAQRAAVAALDGPRYHALLDALENLQADPPLRKGRARKPAVTHLRKVAQQDHARLTARMEAAAEATGGPDRDVALHSARKAARRARHTAESAVPYAGKTADRFRRRAKAVQQLLGEHQDAVITRAELPELAARARTAGHDTYGYGRLHARQDELARQARQALPATWRKARSAKLVRFT